MMMCVRPIEREERYGMKTVKEKEKEPVGGFKKLCSKLMMDDEPLVMQYDGEATVMFDQRKQ